MSLSNPIKIHPLSATDEIFPGIHYKKKIYKALPIDIKVVSPILKIL